MAAKMVTVGCKLPHGLVLHHPLNPDDTVTLKGLNRAVIIGADHATTDIDADFWNAWVEIHVDFKPLKSGAIFVAKNTNDAAAVARELVKEKTGFEPMQTDGKDERATGVKTAKEE